MLLYTLVLCAVLGGVVGEFMIILSEPSITDSAVVIEDSPRSIPLVLGNTYDIKCDTTSEKKWLKKINGEEEEEVGTDDGSGVFTEPNGNGLSLVLQEFSESATGEYICRSGEGGGEFVVNISTGNPILVPKRKVIGLERGLQTTNPSLNIFGSGNPQPTSTDYSWYFNGSAIYLSGVVVNGGAYTSVESNSIVLKNMITMNVGGLYESIVNTSNGITSVAIQLNVEVDPSPEISIITPVNYNDEYLANSESVTVKCSDMEGIPTAIFTWFIDDTPVALTTLTVNITTGDSESFLTISDVTYSTLNGGVIKCVASNVVADVSISVPKTVDLIVRAPPSPPTDLTGESISNCGVALSWLPPPQVADGLTLSAEYYVIEARPEDGEWTVVAERVNDTNVMVDVMDSNGMINVTYYFRIRSGNKRGGASPEATEITDPIQLYYEDLPTVTAVSASPLYPPPKSLLVSWTNSLSNCYTYMSHTIKCHLSTDPPTTIASDATVEGDTTNVMIKNLMFDSKYYCIVSSAVSDMSGNVFPMTTMSDQVDSFTYPASPLSPIQPKLSPTPPTTNNITVTFTLAEDRSNISHYQIMVIRLLDESDLPDDEPDVLYPTGYIFPDEATVNDDIIVKSVQGPYIAAEIAAEIFKDQFIIGDNMTTGQNSSNYKNGPLLSGTKYSCFLRAFPRSNVLLSDKRRRHRRQMNDELVIGTRQYAVFSSSPFMNVVETADSSESDNSSNILEDVFIPIIAAGAVAVILIVLLIILTIVICCVCYKKRKQKKYHLEARSISMTSSSKDSVGEFPAVSTPELCRRAPLTEMAVMDYSSDDDEERDLIPSGAIPVNLFREHVEKFDQARQLLFQREFDWIQRNAPQCEAMASSLPINDDKNRYSNIKAFDHSRVILSEIEGVKGSDYINANYIPGFNRTKEYISTQGPLDQTVVDFWRMVWEQDTATIVMLTNLLEAGKAKCVQYWPPPTVGTLTCGDIEIKLDTVVDLSDYTIRNFTVTHIPTNSSRTVLQFHYIKWPDYGTPKLAAPLLNFLRAVHTSNPHDAGPIIVHCSAGVGRSGTVITIDHCLAQLKADHIIDVRGFVSRMREHRNYMVQTEVQYAFIHYAILEAITYGDTSFSLAEFPHSYQHLQQKNKETGQTLLEEEYSRLGSVKTMSKTSTFIQRVKQKGPTNRSIHYPGHASYSEGNNPHEYNAHYIDSYAIPKLYVIADGPEESTVTKFWQMVWDHQCSSIIMLTPLDNYYGYWPEKGTHETYGNIRVTVEEESAEHYYTTRIISIANAKIGISQKVTQYQFVGWTEKFFPPVPMFVSFVCEVLNGVELLQKNEKALVHDTDSMGQSGIFCSLCYCIKRLHVERMVDVFQAVQTMQLQRPGTIPSMKEYAFVYDCVYEFIRTHSMS